MTIKKYMKKILNTFKYNIIIIVEYYGQMKYELRLLKYGYYDRMILLNRLIDSPRENEADDW